MIINVTLDIAEPDFKIGDRVKLDSFYRKESKYFNKLESPYWDVVGTVTDITTTFKQRIEVQLSDPAHKFDNGLQQYVLWEIHVLFEGSDNPFVFYQNQLIHYTGE